MAAQCYVADQRPPVATVQKRQRDLLVCWEIAQNVELRSQKMRGKPPHVISNRAEGQG